MKMCGGAERVQRQDRMKTEDNTFMVNNRSGVPSTENLRLRHMYRKHNQEVDRVTNLGAEGVTKIIVEDFRTTTAWKAVRGFWDGSNNKCGSSGCVIVIQAVDMIRVSISALEKLEAYILSEVLDLSLGQAVC